MKTITTEEWETKRRNTTVQREDMNKVVMNFLVTEVSMSRLRSHCLTGPQPACKPLPDGSAPLKRSWVAATSCHRL
jgi:hypothetical protein